MTTDRSQAALRIGALALGVALFVAALAVIDMRTVLDTVRRLGIALPVALFFSGLCQLARTWAWAACFPAPLPVRFLHLARIRLSAEAFSYLTLRGIAGEPLKIVLLSGSVGARQATAAVALERLAYILGTTMIVGIGAVLAMVLLPLTPGWFQMFRAFAVTAGVVTGFAAAMVLGRGTCSSAVLRVIDRAFGTSLGAGRVARVVVAIERQMLDLARGNPRRLLVLMAATGASFVFTVLEGWVILRAVDAPITATGAFVVEAFSRVTSFASAFIPANLGALEASSVAAVMAVGVAGGGPALAVARRLRGLFWAGLGLALYPRSRRAPTVQHVEVTNRGAEPHAAVSAV